MDWFGEMMGMGMMGLAVAAAICAAGVSVFGYLRWRDTSPNAFDRDAHYATTRPLGAPVQVPSARGL